MLDALKKLSLRKKLDKPVRYYGRAITMEQAMKATEILVDYYDALKNGKTLPRKPDRALGYLIRCNAIVDLHCAQKNLNLQGIAFKRWALTQEQVVYTWLFAHKMKPEKPLITLSGTSLLFETNSEEIG